MRAEDITRQLNDGSISTTQFSMQLSIILKAKAAHEAIDDWFAECCRELLDRAPNIERTLPYTTLPVSWSNNAFNEAASLAHAKYGDNWHWNEYAWDELIPYYAHRCRALEAQKAIEEGL